VNQLAEAEKSLREAIRYEPKLPQAHYQLGRVLEMQGSHQTALESLQQAVALDAAYPEPHYLLGRIYHRLGNDSLSKTEIDRFQELKKASDTQATPQAPQRQR
jgi:tetratricopeptide (TPR) repeat protein